MFVIMDLEWVKQQAIAPVYVVRGNNDKEWAVDIPLFLDFEFAGIHVFIRRQV